MRDSLFRNHFHGRLSKKMWDNYSILSEKHYQILDTLMQLFSEKNCLNYKHPKRYRCSHQTELAFFPSRYNIIHGENFEGVLVRW